MVALVSGAAGAVHGIAGLLHTSAEGAQTIIISARPRGRELVAVLELARRALAQQMQESLCFDGPQAVRDHP